MITKSQYVWIGEFIRPSMLRFHTLQRWVDRQQRTDDPELVARIERIGAELHALSVTVHYRSCNGGVAGADKPR